MPQLISRRKKQQQHHSTRISGPRGGSAKSGDEDGGGSVCLLTEVEGLLWRDIESERTSFERWPIAMIISIFNDCEYDFYMAV